MGVLNKLKSRMSSYSGPTKADPTMASPVYGFDTGRAVRSGVDAVTAGLAAAANQTPVVSNVGESIAELGASIGSALAARDGEDKKPKKNKNNKNTPTGTFKESKPKKAKPIPKSGIDSKEEISNLDKELNALKNRAV